ncbi:hypothetical protein STEG23_023218 [Scotinomys teguina]
MRHSILLLWFGCEISLTGSRVSTLVPALGTVLGDYEAFRVRKMNCSPDPLAQRKDLICSWRCDPLYSGYQLPPAPQLGVGRRIPPSTPWWMLSGFGLCLLSQSLNLVPLHLKCGKLLTVRGHLSSSLFFMVELEDTIPPNTADARVPARSYVIERPMWRVTEGGHGQHSQSEAFSPEDCGKQNDDDYEALRHRSSLTELSDKTTALGSTLVVLLPLTGTMPSVYEEEHFKSKPTVAMVSLDPVCI